MLKGIINPIFHGNMITKNKSNQKMYWDSLFQTEKKTKIIRNIYSNRVNKKELKKPFSSVDQVEKYGLQVFCMWTLSDDLKLIRKDKDSDERVVRRRTCTGTAVDRRTLQIFILYLFSYSSVGS